MEERVCIGRTSKVIVSNDKVLTEVVHRSQKTAFHGFLPTTHMNDVSTHAPLAISAFSSPIHSFNASAHSTLSISTSAATSSRPASWLWPQKKRYRGASGMQSAAMTAKPSLRNALGRLSTQSYVLLGFGLCHCAVRRSTAGEAKSAAGRTVRAERGSGSNHCR